MQGLVPLFLVLHVLGAIVAFGATFAFPWLAGSGAREPEHANFALRAITMVFDRWVFPLALVQGLTGLGLIAGLGIDLLATPWLLLGVTLYAVAVTFVLTVTMPNLRKLIALTATPPPSGAGGPPPEVAARASAARRNRTIQEALIVAIVFLMVMKPG